MTKSGPMIIFLWPDRVFKKNQYHCTMAIKKGIITGLIVISGIVIILAIYNEKEENAGKKNNAIAEAGRYLFFDNRLSFNLSKSCGSCHDPKFAFTDGYRRSITAKGEDLKHNAPSLVNIALQNYFDWANPSITTLEKQHERPLFNEQPVELGVKGNEKRILNGLKKDSLYRVLFSLAFPGSKDLLDFKHIITCIAAFVRTLRSFQSPYDRYINGDSTALTPRAKAGKNLFFSSVLNCTSCHPPPLFTTAGLTKNTDSIYFNTGLYNISGLNRYPAADNGLASFTGRTADDGKFKTPSLRNVSLTTPYMHDGSIGTLEEVLDSYARGGRNISTGPFAGDGKENKNKDHRIQGFSLSTEERICLISFLYSLEDSSVLKNPAFQNPFNLINK